MGPLQKGANFGFGTLVLRIVHLRLNKSDEVVGRRGARKAALVGDFGDRCANLGRDFPDPRQRGVEATLFEVGFTDGVGERVGRRHEHLVGDQTAAAGAIVPKPTDLPRPSTTALCVGRAAASGKTCSASLPAGDAPQPRK